MTISRYILKLFVIIVLNDINLLNWTVISSKDFSERLPECDYNEYENGCEDREGSDCVEGRCVCKVGHTIQATPGFCLKPAPIGQKCKTSKQCTEYDINSLCFASNDNLDEWVCHCKHDYYYDRVVTQKCLHGSSVGQHCDTSLQCLDLNSVCDQNSRCVCGFDYYFDNILNKCKHNDSIGCNEDQEWNEFINKCQTKVYYSHKGGGRGGGGRGGSGRSSGGRGSGGWRGGTRGGGGAIRGRSWWTTSWFGRSRGGYSSGGSYYSSEEDDSFAWDKLVVIMIAILLIVLACCYCSFKFRQQDRDAEEYWRNRTKRAVPMIVVKGSEDSTVPLIDSSKRISRSSEVGIPSGLQRSRSPSRTSIYDNALYGENAGNSGQQPFPSSPPPPYSPPNGSSVILPFASAPAPQMKTQSRPQSPRPHSPSIGGQSSQNLEPENPPSAPPLYESHSGPHSPQSLPIANPNTTEIVRHPSNPELILPFASSGHSA